ncbi:efflux RND transporter permease subunit [Desulforhopalus singaporensis]|uniref:Hydrophobic/amphiphilic exporter-1, HAE1 family n=1 Tax=Desulforhopalus singaporensis TaxID=91360 RepID=A0A1H0SZH0_9BACT|nr:efflux RND transporter permease subunit [Desulforhopalus singaporensis]SDP46925.1 hydrophobic/amphiphilic exporter-1, HAE1 family [Desulforhopalus singaporensis]
MDIVGYSLEKPVTVAVCVVLLVTFGLIGLNRLPIQLTPDVETPKITVQTTWRGATPFEVEKEIVDRQEEALKGLQGLTKMESSSYNSFGEVTLSFELNTVVEDALLRVSNKLDEVSDYPDNADKPVIEAAGANNSPIVWMVVKTLPGNNENITHYMTFFEEDIRQRFERIKGVGSLFIFGGTENELHVVLDMEKMAQNKITINQLRNAVTESNSTTSAGVMGIGRKNYRIRTVGQFQSPDDVLDVVVYDDGLKKVVLRDIAGIEEGYAKETAAVLHNGEQILVVGLRKETGANVLEMTDRVEAEVNRLNGSILVDRGLSMEIVYDQRGYIETAIGLVKKNVLVGAILAIMVLLLFLRSVRTTFTTAVAIPISVIGTFIFLWLGGRNINVVSLAGISFAVGMLVDNSIVVLENIDRHLKLGKKAYAAALDGAKEVWGAVFASTATTVAVFLPVIFMKEEAGQLFRDIAIAITFSIIISFVVSVSVIPTLINQLYRSVGGGEKNRFQRSVVGPFLADLIMTISRFCQKNTITRLATVLLFTVASVVVIVALKPPAEYLPQGNRNLVINILLPPPGYSVEKYKEIGGDIYQQVKPYFTAENRDGLPGIKQMFFVGADRFTLFGALSTAETRAAELIPLFMRIMGGIPGVFGVSLQAGIFEQGLGEGRTVEVNISGQDIDKIAGAATRLYGTIQQKIKGAQVRPVPSLETSYPEILVIPDKARLAANGLTERDLGIYVDILMDGRRVDDYSPAGMKEIDLVVKGSNTEFDSPEDILGATIVNSYGDLITLGEVADLKYSQSMPQVNHLERKRTITLQVTPPKTLPLQSAMEIVESGIVAPAESSGNLEGVEVAIGGNADKLVQTGESLKWNLVLALLITYLLLSALFENFFYPLIILFTVPLAAAGGFAGLLTVNSFIARQGFDVLAMLGFIILIGTVVNNAILIVHQSLNNVRYNGLSGMDSIAESVRTRIRPIFMSATTSVLAMSPLVVSTGSGSELYRGLGSILLGGLAVSTMFTLFVIPALLAFVIRFERSRSNEMH